jgi:DNA helicase HerA-like ATPase
VLGQVVSEGRRVGLDYAIRTDQLTKHCLVVGTTGSGKTNTVFHLLRQLDPRRCPFLVIEPTKREYRALVREPEFKELRVYTLGNELGLPLRLNPLVPEPGTSIAEHIDLLKGVIGASIGAWNPLPQILEKALYRVFQEFGWDIVRSTNFRVRGDVTPVSAYPTLADLLETSTAVTRELGYSERVGPDIEAALRVRLESLLTGGKGRMLATREQQPIAQLVSRPTVLELESLVDEDECAFVMGVLLIKIVQYLRALGNTNDCRLIVIVEEAHRLLGEAHRSSPEVEGSARFKAVSMFANLLAEVRAYGAGLIICDQSPSKLARDVLKNTNAKITHRIVADDDAAALAVAMRIREEQTGALVSLPPGTATVFSDGDDYPVLITVPLVKKGAAWPSNDELRRSDAAAGSQTSAGGSPWNDRLSSSQEWVETIDRLLNVLVGTPAIARNAWSATCDVARRHLTPLPVTTEMVKEMAATELDRALRQRGRTYAWTYSDLDKLIDALSPVLNALANGEDSTSGSADADFRALAQPLHRLDTGPLLSCSESCGTGRGVECFYRSSADRLSASRDLIAAWRTAASAPDNEVREQLVTVAVRASETMIGAGRSPDTEQSFRRAAFCFAQHMVARETSTRPPSRALTTNRMIWRDLRAANLADVP